ncbi:MAG: quinol:electron acceptor oxidoreductase subunit ActD [Terriglobia bacterium]
MRTNLKAIYGIYPGPEAAERAHTALQVTFKYFGGEALAIEVVSSEPYDDYEFGRLGQRTSMAWIAALGGLVGGVAGYFLTSLTQSAYPLPTGGMPLSPHWTNGIITYELTMLGAILATLGTLAVATHVPGRRSPLADPAVAEGKIVVGVRNPPESVRVEIERALRSAGAESVVCRT